MRTFDTSCLRVFNEGWLKWFIPNKSDAIASAQSVCPEMSGRKVPECLFISYVRPVNSHLDSCLLYSYLCTGGFSIWCCRCTTKVKWIPMLHNLPLFMFLYFYCLCLLTCYQCFYFCLFVFIFPLIYALSYFYRHNEEHGLILYYLYFIYVFLYHFRITQESWNAGFDIQ